MAWPRRSGRGASARCTLGAPQRAQTELPPALAASPSHNPVVDALRLVDAFRAAQSKTVVLGGPEPTAFDGSRWVVTLERDGA